MNTSTLVAAFVARVPSAPAAPTVAAQEKSAPAKPATSRGVARKVFRLQEGVKEMQHQLG